MTNPALSVEPLEISREVIASEGGQTVIKEALKASRSKPDRAAATSLLVPKKRVRVPLITAKQTYLLNQ